MIKNSDLSIVVPAYNRVHELSELLDSVLALSVYPGRVIISEDFSPEREAIITLCLAYKDRFKQLGIDFILYENPLNLGYDKNLRQCIEKSESKWVCILGNDDLLLPNAITHIVDFVNTHDVDLVSRAFVRFNRRIDEPLGVSKIARHDCLFNRHTTSSKMIFRSAGFVGGLVVNVDFAKRHSTEKYDGFLFYQIYLAALAFCDKGVGYIATPIVGGRADNPPLFGAAADEHEVHVPGGYTAKGRAKMWSGVMNIVRDVGSQCGIDLLPDIVNELDGRQSFHVFEMNARSSRSDLKQLRQALINIGLFQSLIPKCFYWVNLLLGRRAIYFYKLARRMMQ